MSEQVRTVEEWPDAPYYVTATDTFMSGWGQAEHLENIVVLPTDSAEQAEWIACYANNHRTDMTDVTISGSKAEDRDGVIWSIMSPADAPAWYDHKNRCGL